MKRRTRLRWWLHSQRFKHDRAMAYSQALVEMGESYQRISKREKDNDLLVQAYRQFRAGGAVARECGCPRMLWANNVRSAPYGKEF